MDLVLKTSSKLIRIVCQSVGKVYIFIYIHILTEPCSFTLCKMDFNDTKSYRKGVSESPTVYYVFKISCTKVTMRIIKVYDIAISTQLK